MEVKPGSKGASETAAESEDILDVLALRIDQLAASDSEDDLFSGMLLPVYESHKCMICCVELVIIKGGDS